MYKQELTHWGILGMKWGRRRYQNKDGSLTPAGKKRYDDDNDSENIDLDENSKQRILTSGNATEVLKYRNSFNNKELGDALTRLNYTKQLSQLSDGEVKSGYDKVKSFMNRVGEITDMANKGINAYNVVAKVNNTFNKKELPVLDGNNAAKKQIEKSEKKLMDDFIRTATPEQVLERWNRLSTDDIQAINRRMTLEQQMRGRVRPRPRP